MNNWMIFYFITNAFLGSCNSHSIEHYLGCYRYFNGIKLHLQGVSVATCFDNCQNSEKLYSFSAVKNGIECYCGDDFGKSTQEVNCQVRCVDTSNGDCGQKYYSVYSICPIGRHGEYCNLPCNKCKNSVPCMRKNSTCFRSKCLARSSDNCEIARLFNNVNVAFNRHAEHIKTFTYNYIPWYPAKYAVDGNHDSNLNNNHCSKTENFEEPWFYVDLEMRRNIRKVNITNREDIHARRLVGGHVYLSNSHPTAKKEYFCGAVETLHDIEVKCESSLKYRYVIVTLQQNQFLTICEIEAFIDECSECRLEEECESIFMNGRNHSRCTCKEGLEREDIYSRCTALDHCSGGTHDCDIVSTNCNAVEGSYQCECKVGYEPDDHSTKKCSDIDECLTNQHSCDLTKSTCLNNEGSYTCKCKDGFVNAQNGCIDINECLNKEHECDETTSTCQNTGGSYRCVCKSGYNWTDNQERICADINECETEIIDKNVICINSIGSFELKCQQGYHIEKRNNTFTCKEDLSATEGSTKAGLNQTTILVIVASVALLVLIILAFAFIYFKVTRKIRKIQADSSTPNAPAESKLPGHDRLSSVYDEINPDEELAVFKPVDGYTALSESTKFDGSKLYTGPINSNTYSVLQSIPAPRVSQTREDTRETYLQLVDDGGYTPLSRSNS